MGLQAEGQRITDKGTCVGVNPQNFFRGLGIALLSLQKYA